MLPLDLVLVRHGESEGNAAKRLSEEGSHHAFSKDFRARHSASFRLTDRGQEQARLAGVAIQEKFLKNGIGFDRYITSEYIRAVETATLLNLPNAEWFREPYLAERDWGKLDILPQNEREEKYGASLRLRTVEPYFWRPPNGESFAQLRLRIDRVLHTLHEECRDKRVLIVCHGEVIQAFRVSLERISQEQFRELTFSKDPDDRIYNCDIFHYTRRSPENGKLAPYANWMRKLRVQNNEVVSFNWKEISRRRYTNKDLLEIVNRVPRMIA